MQEGQLLLFCSITFADALLSLEYIYSSFSDVALRVCETYVQHPTPAIMVSHDRVKYRKEERMARYASLR